MTSCEAKTHNLLYGANVNKLFALYIVPNKTQLCGSAVSQRSKPAAKIWLPNSTQGLQPVTSCAGHGLQPLSQHLRRYYEKFGL